MTADPSPAMSALTAAAAVGVGQRSGLFDALAGGRSDVATLAQTTATRSERLHTLLRALAALGVVATDGVSWWLCHDPELWRIGIEQSAQIDRWLAGDEPRHDAGDRSQAAALYPTYVAALGYLMAPVVARAIGGFDPPPRHVLEVGAGASPWGRAFAGRGSRVTALDLPSVIEVTRRIVTDAGLDDRFDYVAGDVFDDDLAASLADGFDLVVASGLLRLFAPDQARDLVRRLHGWTRPGGGVLVVDAVVADEPTTADLYALNLAMRTRRGGVHPATSFASWLRDAGFRDVHVDRGDRPELTLIRAVRPDPDSLEETR